MQHDVSLIISDLSAGGAQRVVSTLAAAWANAGRRVAVITLAKQKRDYFVLAPSVTRIALGRMGESSGVIAGVISNIQRMRALRQALRECEAPVAIAFVGATNILAVLASCGLPIRLVISERNDPARQSLGRVWDLLRRSLYRYADLVTANSHNAIETLSKFVPTERLAHVMNPVSLPEPLPDRIEKSIILNVGRLHPQKAQDTLIAAFAAVASEVSGWRLELLGNGDLEAELRLQASALGVGDRVEIAGRIDPWPYYAHAAIFALPSRFEGTPNALLEAMSLGVPPIVSDAAGGALNFVEHQVTGLVVPVDNVVALAAALRELVNDETLRKKLGQAARDRVAECTPQSALPAWDTLLGLPPLHENGP